MRFLLRAVFGPAAAGIVTGSVVQAVNKAGEFLSTEPVGGMENYNSPAFIATAMAALVAAGVTGYLLNRSSERPSEPLL